MTLPNDFSGLQMEQSHLGEGELPGQRAVKQRLVHPGCCKRAPGGKETRASKTFQGQWIHGSVF